MQFTKRAREIRKKGELGGSLVITIPHEVVEAYKINKDDLVTMELIKVTRK